jgi:hypothetical protein
MYEPDKLAILLEEDGWAAHVATTGWFIFGSAKSIQH